ncbi:hypothetical protein BDQ17DRAFT_1513802 [Cyathus striatus]|nr:hypothetical protein BDQ17DRAFT_1513802 [Cyathus striatus]
MTDTREHRFVGSHLTQDSQGFDSDVSISEAGLPTPNDLHTRKVQDEAIESLNYNLEYNDTEKEVEKWDRMYISIRTDILVPGPANKTSGKKCVEHISKFFEMFEWLSEIHFAAASGSMLVIISSLKALLSLFKDYFEIDNQILLVLVSATDVMRVLLDLRRLKISEELRSRLIQERDRIRSTIKNFGNVIDTFYKDRNYLKRLLKADDLIEKLKQFITEFDSHKDDLRRLLDIDTNVGIQSINKKLESFAKIFEKFERMVSVETDFRKKVTDFQIDLHDQEGLLKLDGETKMKLINLLNRSDPRDRSSKELQSQEKESRDSTAIDRFDEMVKGIKVSFDVMCKENEERFTSKFTLQTKQIQDSISNAKNEIIGEIRKGPYMRIKQKELRDIWKEMGWVFCVKNKHFGMALIEYFIDHFSSIDGPTDSQEDTGLVKGDNADAKANQDISETFRRKAWTLFYLLKIPKDILSAIDVDGTGFIRISEANEFTNGMPSTWSLSEWSYNMTELLRLVKGPLPLDVTMLDQLKSLVYSYAREKDDDFREKFKEFNYCIDAENTIRLLGNEKELETYVLQIFTLLLENWLKILYDAEHVVLGLKDLDKVLISLQILADAVYSRKEFLLDVFDEDYLNTEYGGLYRLYGKPLAPEDKSMTHQYDEMEYNILINEILEEFPVPTERPMNSYIPDDDSSTREHYPPIYHWYD